MLTWRVTLVEEGWAEGLIWGQGCKQCNVFKTGRYSVWEWDCGICNYREKDIERPGGGGVVFCYVYQYGLRRLTCMHAYRHAETHTNNILIGKHTHRR